MWNTRLSLLIPGPRSRLAKEDGRMDGRTGALFQYVNILSNTFSLRRWITVFVSFFSRNLMLIIRQIAAKTTREICEQHNTDITKNNEAQSLLLYWGWILKWWMILNSIPWCVLLKFLEIKFEKISNPATLTELKVKNTVVKTGRVEGTFPFFKPRWALGCFGSVRPRVD